MGYEIKEVFKAKTLVYEFIGSALLVTCFNLTSTYNGLMLVVLLWAWNNSAAHFNPAVTIGEFIQKSNDPIKLLKGTAPCLVIIFAQLLGASGGIGLTRLCSKKNFLRANPNKDPALFIIDYNPTPALLCPSIDQRCNTQYLTWVTFSSEFLGTTLVVFTYILIRNLELDATSKKFMQFLGPFCVYATYSAAITMLNSTSSGIINPIVAYGAAIWNLIFYQYEWNPVNVPGESGYDRNHLGRYVWIYLVAPLCGGLLGGLLSKVHLGSSESGELRKSINED